MKVHRCKLTNEVSAGAKYLATIDVLHRSFTEEKVDEVSDVVRRHEVRLCNRHRETVVYLFRAPIM